MNIITWFRFIVSLLCAGFIVPSVSCGPREVSQAFMALVRDGSFEDARVLLEQKIDVSYIDSKGYTPLTCAACYGDLDLVQDLVAMGCDLFHVSAYGYTPLMVAAMQGRREIVKFLAEMYVKYPMPLFNGKLVDINFKNADGCTALFLAAAHGFNEVVSLLISFGASVDITNRQRSTALVRAASYGNVDVVKTLLASGANPNHLDLAQQCPLMCALTEQEDIEVVLYLLLYKAQLISNDLYALINSHPEKSYADKLEAGLLTVVFNKPSRDALGVRERLLMHLLSMMFVQDSAHITALKAAYPEQEGDLARLPQEIALLYRDLCRNYAIQVCVQGSLLMGCVQGILADRKLCYELGLDMRTFNRGDIDVLIEALAHRKHLHALLKQLKDGLKHRNTLSAALNRNHDGGQEVELPLVNLIAFSGASGPSKRSRYDSPVPGAKRICLLEDFESSDDVVDDDSESNASSLDIGGVESDQGYDGNLSSSDDDLDGDLSDND
jgi:hypothetical protein